MSKQIKNESYWFTRIIFLRALGFIYLIAFIIISKQWLPLLGTNGLLPVQIYLDQLINYQGKLISLALPSIFWINSSNVFMLVMSYFGIFISILAIFGFANIFIFGFLWFLYLSYIHVGQIFYGYGWEIMLIETGFLAIFLCPFWYWKRTPPKEPPSKAVILLLRWLLFRLMFGAGLIKLRGDQCWRDLTCMFYHYETQPIPNPISWYLHQFPEWFHKLETLWNHFVELIIPFFIFTPRKYRHTAGFLLIFFQITLIISGNLSWLNWLTLVICISCFDDSISQFLFSKKFRKKISNIQIKSKVPKFKKHSINILVILIVILSINPVMNMLSPKQIMNTSFDPFNLVNTYGAFGSIGKKRVEIVIKGTNENTISENTVWKEYEFICKPGNTSKIPCIISPYHSRIDWQVWFVPLSPEYNLPWLSHLVYKLLHNDSQTLSLISHNPFPNNPPTFIKIDRYQYEFTDSKNSEKNWWKREKLDTFINPVSQDDPTLINYLKTQNLIQ